MNLNKTSKDTESQPINKLFDAFFEMQYGMTKFAGIVILFVHERV
jgi:hypothetical protein